MSVKSKDSSGFGVIWCSGSKDVALFLLCLSFHLLAWVFSAQLHLTVSLDQARRPLPISTYIPTVGIIA